MSLIQFLGGLLPFSSPSSSVTRREPRSRC